MNLMDEILKFLLLSSTIYLQTVFSCEIYSFGASDGPLALEGHVIKNITKNIVNLCWADCVWLPWCFSLNTRQTSELGMFECELNNSSKRAKPNNMVTRQGWTYYEMQDVDENNRKLYEFKRKEDLGDGWLRYGNSSLKFFQEKKNWTDARSDCQSLGGNLASITSSHENYFLYGVFVENLNLTYTEPDSVDFTYFHWKLNGDEPSVKLLGTPGDAKYEFTDGEKALYLKEGTGYAEMPAQLLNPDEFTIGFWIKILSNTKIWKCVLYIGNDRDVVEFYIKMDSKEMRLNVKNTLVASTSYDLNIWNHFAMDWKKSLKRVRLGRQGEWKVSYQTSFTSLDITNTETIRIGALSVAQLSSDLAPHVYIKNLVIANVSLVQPMMYLHEEGVWIGMNNKENTNDFGWSDGTPVQYLPAMPPYWSSVKPNSTGRKCVAMARERKWLDKNCMQKYPFICEKPAPS